MSNIEPPAPPPPPPPPPPGGPAGPPPGGFGGPPPGGFGAPAPVPGGQWDLGAAVSYGWTKFQANVAQFVIAGAAILAGVIVLVIAWVVINAALYSGDASVTITEDGYNVDSPGPGFLGALVLAAVFVGVFFVFVTYVGAGIIRGALGVTEGREFRAGEIFKFDKAGPVLVTALILGAGVAVGTVLCYLPGIAFAFISSYAMYFVLDKGLAPVEAIKASFALVKDNLATTLVWYIIAGLIGGAGAILCGVGIVATYPIAILGTAYTYKVLTGQEVAA